MKVFILFMLMAENAHNSKIFMEFFLWLFRFVYIFPNRVAFELKIRTIEISKYQI